MDEINGIPTTAQEQLNTLKGNMSAMKEMLTLNAGLIWVKYKALLDQGFSEDQALTLCKTLF